ncbi:hypothetical protein EBL_c27550 [Shimwellia blattae DSM 4481 = NBRC 105725]|uniref:Uncharacterized protein n=1 Tax=Shimwellia blattae (strain ATCC 29907 / DSM 4481 / JCM 1650 / NBRC 105725 / CDC 9005-74) TaxID=630626 RepID=I2BBC2_SHIBC|nr:hypothetical protein EBL_c27550 [Shimwellia blattae DSM 4481 = NBRC 105725]
MFLICFSVVNENNTPESAAHHRRHLPHNAMIYNHKIMIIKLKTKESPPCNRFHKQSHSY